MAVQLDHLVVAAHTLDQGVAHITNLLGVAPSGGGRHVGMGTWNKVLHLGDATYLEVIAIDPSSPHPDRPRWLGLDDPTIQAMLRERPRLITWVARTHDLITSSSLLPVPINIRMMSRGDLSWQFAFTADGALMEHGLIPHLIQWDAGQSHPTASMPDHGLRLSGLRGFHPQPDLITPYITALGVAHQCVIRKTTPLQPPYLQAMIQTAHGVMILE